MEKDRVQNDFHRNKNSCGQDQKQEPKKRQSLRELLVQSEPNLVKQQEAESETQRQTKLELGETMTLKRRQRQLIEEEYHLHNCLSELQKQLVLLKKSTPLVAKPLQTECLFDQKSLLRHLLKIYQDQIEVCIRILKHICEFATNPEPLCELLNKYEEQLLDEILIYDRIGYMNESEAWSNLERSALEWLEMQQRREDIEKLVEKEQQNLSLMLDGNKLRQQVLVELRYDIGETNSSKDQLGYVELPAGQWEFELEQICVAFSKLRLDDTKRDGAESKG